MVKAGSIDVNLSSGARAEIGVSESLDVDISSEGSVEYTGYINFLKFLNKKSCKQV
jgi:hypothetical protein